MHADALCVTARKSTVTMSGSSNSAPVDCVGTLSYDSMVSLVSEKRLVRCGDHQEVKEEKDSVQGIQKSCLQPSSLDLTLSAEAYKLPGSILPLATESVRELLEKLRVEKQQVLDLTQPVLLDRNRVYMVRLQEILDLPPNVSAYCNNKSSTGRIDVSTRTVTDCNPRYDKIPRGYKGEVWLQITSRSFDVVLQQGLTLNQAIFYTERHLLPSSEMRELYDSLTSLLYDRDGQPIPLEDAFLDEGGLMLTLDLDQPIVGYVARRTFHPLDLTQVGAHAATQFFDPIPRPEEGDYLWLEKGRFYIFSTFEYIRVPSHLASEMIPFDSTSGEFRAHYAGFFDPGFGFGFEGEVKGTPAVLEVRCYEDDLVIRHRQPIARMQFESLDQPPSKIYDTSCGSTYAHQRGPRLSKYFI